MKAMVCLAGALMGMGLAQANGVDAEDDRATENFLLNARVVAIEEMLPGSTEPMAIQLEMWGSVRKAAFKYRPADLSGPEEADSFRYEVAAYRLDRVLGLGMVPVAVIRNVHAEGAVIEWISGGSSVEKLEERGRLPVDPASLARQQAAMRMFDALILNRDRKPSDQIITAEDGRLHLLDHSRAFGTATELPAGFEAEAAGLPSPILARLAELDADSLESLLGDLLAPEQLEALLIRRDRVVARLAPES